MMHEVVIIENNPTIRGSSAVWSEVFATKDEAVDYVLEVNKCSEKFNAALAADKNDCRLTYSHFIFTTDVQLSEIFGWPQPSGIEEIS